MDEGEGRAGVRKAPIDRFVVGVALVTLLLVGIGLASIVVVGRQPTPAPDFSRPDGVVLAYLRDRQEGREQDAQALYSANALQTTAGPPGSPPKPIAPPPRVSQPQTSQRIQVTSTQIDGDRATVNLEITSFRADSPITPSESSYQQSIPLVQEGGQWKIDQILYLP
jgi:hypothetical protein